MSKATVSPKEGLLKRFRLRVLLCRIISGLLMMLILFLSFCIMASAYGQETISSIGRHDTDVKNHLDKIRTSDELNQITFSGEGIAKPSSLHAKQLKILNKLDELPQNDNDTILLMYKLTDSICDFKIARSTLQYVDGFRAIRMTSLEFNAMVRYMRAYITNPQYTGESKYIGFYEITKSLLLFLVIILCVPGIRYFILLSVHYGARADALMLIGDERLLVEQAITMTSASGIDFRISKNLKNELLELSKTNAKKESDDGCCQCGRKCRLNT